MKNEELGWNQELLRRASRMDKERIDFSKKKKKKWIRWNISLASRRQFRFYNPFVLGRKRNRYRYETDYWPFKKKRKEKKMKLEKKKFKLKQKTKKEGRAGDAYQVHNLTVAPRLLARHPTANQGGPHCNPCSRFSL